MTSSPDKYFKSKTTSILRSVDDLSVSSHMPRPLTEHTGIYKRTSTWESMVESPSQAQKFLPINTSKQMPSQIAPKSPPSMRDDNPTTMTPLISPNLMVPTSLDPWKLDTDIMLGSEVEVTLSGHTCQGTVKWIGYTADPTKPIAGLEMVSIIRVKASILLHCYGINKG